MAGSSHSPLEETVSAGQWSDALAVCLLPRNSRLTGLFSLSLIFCIERGQKNGALAVKAFFYDQQFSSVVDAKLKSCCSS